MTTLIDHLAFRLCDLAAWWDGPRYQLPMERWEIWENPPKPLRIRGVAWWSVWDGWTPGRYV